MFPSHVSSPLPALTLDRQHITVGSSQQGPTHHKTDPISFHVLQICVIQRCLYCPRSGVRDTTPENSSCLKLSETSMLLMTAAFIPVLVNHVTDVNQAPAGRSTVAGFSICSFHPKEQVLTIFRQHSRPPRFPCSLPNIARFQARHRVYR